MRDSAFSIFCQLIMSVSSAYDDERNSAQHQNRDRWLDGHGDKEPMDYVDFTL